MTALAEAELEYNDAHRSTAMYCAFPLVPSPTSGNDGASGTSSSSSSSSSTAGSLLQAFPQLEAVIWTTTPWTIPSNMAICANSSLEYVVVEVSVNGSADVRHLLMTEKASQELFGSEASPYSIVIGAKTGDDDGATATTTTSAKIVHRLQGDEIVGLAAKHPLREDGMAHHHVPVLHGDHVTSDAGSGLVHTAPSHGVDDFEVGWSVRGTMATRSRTVLLHTFI